MSISKRISESSRRYEARDYEGALLSICAAVEVTARAEGYGKGGNGYKEWIHDNLGFITRLAFGNVSILNLRLVYNHPGIKPAADGLCTIEQIIYHVVRCGLYHEAALPANLRFTGEGKITTEGGVLILPGSIAMGLTLAVATSPTNRHCVAEAGSMVNVGSDSVPLASLWGNRQPLLDLLDKLGR